MVGYHVFARFRDMNGNDVTEIRCAVYKKNVLEESKRRTRLIPSVKLYSITS